MSKQDIEKFRGEVEKDPSLLSQLQSQKDHAGFVSKTVELAKSRGYSFSADDVKKYLSDAQSGALSDDALRSVAGGAQGNLQRYTYSRPGCN